MILANGEKIKNEEYLQMAINGAIDIAMYETEVEDDESKVSEKMKSVIYEWVEFWDKVFIDIEENPEKIIKAYGSPYEMRKEIEEGKKIEDIITELKEWNKI
jgi:hypothetical protein